VKLFFFEKMKAFDVIKREFRNSMRSDSQQKASLLPSFTISQFNVLADYLSDSFPHTDPKVLTWEYRKDRLKQEILQYKSSIICMEEVDHFDDFFLPIMKSEGYDGLFKKKIDPKAKDGCAFFYDTKKFYLIRT